MFSDNDALNKRIFKLMDDAQKILTAAAKTAVGIPPITGGIQGGGLLRADKVFEGGTPVSVKITVARVVAPGLYKVLKPKELATFDEAAATAIDANYKKRILVPIAPYTDIAFNTYEVMVFEAAPMAGDSPLRMHQTLDVSMGGGSPGTNPAPIDLTLAEANVNGFLITSTIDATVSLSPSSDGTTVQVRVTPGSGITLSEDEKALILDAVRDTTGKQVELVQ